MENQYKKYQTQTLDFFNKYKIKIISIVIIILLLLGGLAFGQYKNYTLEKEFNKVKQSQEETKKIIDQANQQIQVLTEKAAALEQKQNELSKTMSNVKDRYTKRTAEVKTIKKPEESTNALDANW